MLKKLLTIVMRPRVTRLAKSKAAASGLKTAGVIRPGGGGGADGAAADAGVVIAMKRRLLKTAHRATARARPTATH